MWDRGRWTRGPWLIHRKGGCDWQPAFLLTAGEGPEATEPQIPQCECAPRPATPVGSWGVCVEGLRKEGVLALLPEGEDKVGGVRGRAL